MPHVLASAASATSPLSWSLPRELVSEDHLGDAIGHVVPLAVDKIVCIKRVRWYNIHHLVTKIRNDFHLVCVGRAL